VDERVEAKKTAAASSWAAAHPLVPPMWMSWRNSMATPQSPMSTPASWRVSRTTSRRVTGRPIHPVLKQREYVDSNLDVAAAAMSRAGLEARRGRREVGPCAARWR
jgi:hypothetical protein